MIYREAQVSGKKISYSSVRRVYSGLLVDGARTRQLAPCCLPSNSTAGAAKATAMRVARTAKRRMLDERELVVVVGDRLIEASNLLN